jgi:hypothetical protein
MKAMLGISLYSYPYVKLAKTLCLSNYCLCLLCNKIGEEGRTGSSWKQGGWGVEREGAGEGTGGEMAQTIYAHMNFKKVLQFKENENTTYQNLWDTAKAVVRKVCSH